MHQGKYVFSQVVSLISKYEFKKSVERYAGDYRSKDFKSWPHLLCMLFGQLTYSEGLRGYDQLPWSAPGQTLPSRHQIVGGPFDPGPWEREQGLADMVGFCGPYDSGGTCPIFGGQRLCP